MEIDIKNNNNSSIQKYFNIDLKSKILENDLKITKPLKYYYGTNIYTYNTVKYNAELLNSDEYRCNFDIYTFILQDELNLMFIYLNSKLDNCFNLNDDEENIKFKNYVNFITDFEDTGMVNGL